MAEARRAGLEVVRAVMLPGDERAIEPPAVGAPMLTRTIQDIRPLKPARPLPLIADILAKGAEGARGDYLIFSNMDIAVQPHFYASLRDLIMNRFDTDGPFVVYRRNIEARFCDLRQLEEMYAAQGTVAYGFDCFVFPARYQAQLDLGTCCVGSGHFDNLLYVALDAASCFRGGRIIDVPLTFHICNKIEWTRHMDYLEHNLREAMGALRRMRVRLDVPRNSAFARMERSHFLPNARIDSVMFRKIKRLPGVAKAAHQVKKWIGRSH